MKINKKFVALAVASISVLGSSVAANAAPDLGTTTTATCTITKSGSNYNLYASGTFDASKTNYLINGYSAILMNNGSQKVQTIPLTAIAPTSIGSNTLFNMNVDFKFASSLKNVTYYVYNGSKVKGTAIATCQHIGWN